MKKAEFRTAVDSRLVEIINNIKKSEDLEFDSVRFENTTLGDVQIVIKADKDQIEILKDVYNMVSGQFGRVI